MAQQNVDTDNDSRDLQTELCSAQDWVKQTGQRIVVVFEGRDRDFSIRSPLST